MITITINTLSVFHYIIRLIVLSLYYWSDLLRRLRKAVTSSRTIVTSDFDSSESRSGSPRTSGGDRAADPKTWSPENDEEIVKKYNIKGKTVKIDRKLSIKVTLLCSLYLCTWVLKCAARIQLFKETT